MALFIASTDGTTTFDVGQAELDIIQIAVMDTGVGFDETNTVTFDGVTCIPVTYSRTETGPTAVRLDDLVNENTYTAPPNIIIFAVDDTFILPDGTPVKGNAFAVPIGSPANPFANQVCTFYDLTLCGDDGIWVDKEGGGTTSMSTPVMLYHELAHCFHYVTGVTTTEVLAEIDENDMRDVVGLAHRDVNSHNGGCGGGPINCCIIASLASGSEFSELVIGLRALRDQTLRGSEAGDNFFQAFFESYYSFSPEITRLFGRYPDLMPVARDYFVFPLLCGLEFLDHYTKSRGQNLTRFLLAQYRDQNLKTVYSFSFLNEIKAVLDAIKNMDRDKINHFSKSYEKKIPGFRQLVVYTQNEILSGAYIKWSLLEVIWLWVFSTLLVQTKGESPIVEERIRQIIGDWFSRMPISGFWEDLPALHVRKEMAFLDNYFFDPEAKYRFSRRLIKKFPVHKREFSRWGGYPC